MKTLFPTLIALLLSLVEAAPLLANAPELIYRQNFGNNTGNNLSLNQARAHASSIDWYAYIDNGTEANDHPQVVISYLTGTSQGLTNVGIAPATSNTQGYLAVSMNNNLNEILVFTREFPVSIEPSANPPAFHWHAGHAEAGYATRIAVEINDQWYVSNDRYHTPRVGAGSNFPTQGIRLQLALDSRPHRWRLLELVPNEKMAIGEYLQSPGLPNGTITGFGFFIERQGATNAWVRHDVLTLVTNPQPISELWHSSLYPATWSPPDENADFYSDKIIQDFSYAGYHLGDRPVPQREGLLLNVTHAPYNADPSGMSDSTSAIQAAINAAAAAGGGVVYMPAGTYAIAPPTGASAALRITQSNIVLRGAGPEQTYLINTEYNMRNKRIIHALGPSSSSWTNSTTPSTAITRDLMGPSRQIPVADTSLFNVGNTVIVRNNITEAWIDDHNEPNWSGYAASFSGTLYARKIIDIDRESNLLLVDIPTRYALKMRDGARVHRSSKPIEEVGLEDFSIGNLQHPGSGWGNEDYTDATKAAYQVHGSFAIEFLRVENSWMRRVHSFRPPQNSLNAHILSNGVRLQHARSVTLDSVRMQRVQYGGGGGNGYTFRFSNASDNLLIDCISSHNRHGFVFSGMSAHGNVIHNCVDRATRWAASMLPGGSGSDHHMHFSHSNLADQSTVDSSYFDARYRPFGSIPQHNLTSAHSVFWNTTGIGQWDFAIRSEQSRYGYAIGTQGSVTGVLTNNTRPQTLPEDHVEGVASAYWLTPQSLYRDQLARRQQRLELLPTVAPGELPHSAVRLRVAAVIGSALGITIDDLDFHWEIMDDPAGASIASPHAAETWLLMSRSGSRQVRLQASHNGELLAQVELAAVLKPIESDFSVVDPILLEPVDDSYAFNNEPNANYGNEATLLAKGWNTSHIREAFLKFDLTALPAYSSFGDATLHLYKTNNGSAYSGRIVVLDDATWSEQTLNWNNRPTDGETAFISAIIGPTPETNDPPQTTGFVWTDSGQSGERIFNLGSIISEHIQSDKTALSLRIIIEEQMDSTDVIRFASKENAQPERRPYISVPTASQLSYDSWSESSQIPLNERDPTLDRFGHGISNLMAYATGIDPANPAKPMARVRIENGEVIMQMPWLGWLADPVYFIGEKSHDLQHWTPLGPAEWTKESLDAQRNLYQTRLPLPHWQEKEFYRIRLIRD